MPIETVIGRGLAKTYRQGVKALDGVDFVGAKGTISGLIGANGSGKTTLLRVLSGALTPDAGEISLLGLRQPSFSALRRLQSKIAYVDQDPALDPEMTGLETLRLMKSLYNVTSNVTSNISKDDDIAARFGIQDVLPRAISTYSGGQKRRLHVAAALVHSPEVIFLDEPAAGLDPGGVRWLWDELDRRAHDGATIVIASHDLDQLEREASLVMILHHGKIIASGSPAQLIDAHAQTWLRVTLKAPPENSLSLTKTVEALPGFSRVSVEGRRISLVADDFTPTRAAELMSAIAVEIADLAVHRRDLASVYRTLTGSDLETPNQTRGRK